MTRTCLPTWPFVLFGVIEPILLVWAWVTVLTGAPKFYADQAPNHPITAAGFTPQAEVLTYQMGNVLLLLAGIAIICCWTQHREIAFWYLVVVGFADFGHIYASYRADPDYFWNFAQWNAMMAVLELFGRLSANAGSAKKNH